MNKTDLFIILLSVVLCGISFYLVIRKKEEKNKKFIIYSIISSVMVIGIAIMLQCFYIDNVLYKNIRMLELLSLLAPIAYVDYKELRIPNEYIILGIIYWVLSIFIEILCGSHFVKVNVVSSLIAAIALLIAAGLCKICIKGSIGAGDIKLFIVMGLLLGLDGIWSAIFMSLIISFFIALFFLISKKKSKKDAMAFGPALALGTWLSIFLTGM